MPASAELAEGGTECSLGRRRDPGKVPSRCRRCAVVRSVAVGQRRGAQPLSLEGRCAPGSLSAGGKWVLVETPHGPEGRWLSAERTQVTGILHDGHTAVRRVGLMSSWKRQLVILSVSSQRSVLQCVAWMHGVIGCRRRHQLPFYLLDNLSAAAILCRPELVPVRACLLRETRVYHRVTAEVATHSQFTA